MVTITCLSPWADVGVAGHPRYRPAIVDAYSLTDWSDITGQPMENLPTEPNLMVLRVTCDEVTADRIESDGVYPILTTEAPDA
jgi:hypothetical protein